LGLDYEPVQEPVYLVWLKAHCAWMHTDKEGFDKTADDERWMLYTTPPAQPSPDFLNALKRIVDEPNNTMSDGKALKEIIRIARAAIAKETGEKK
jgi:hypothetical protein